MIKNTLIIDSNRFNSIPISVLQYLDFVVIHEDGEYIIWKNRFTSKQDVALDKDEFLALLAEISETSQRPTFIECEVEPRY